MLDDAVRALIESDSMLANAVKQKDDEVDAANDQIEAECMRLVIQQQPIAHDLRFVGMIFQAITDVERIADHAVDIAKIALEMETCGGYLPIVNIPRLAERVRAMYNDTVAAFAKHDIELVARVVADDDEIDDLFHEQRATLLAEMTAHPERAILCTNLIFVAQFLERIGDRCVNIAERTHQIEKIDKPRSK